MEVGNYNSPKSKFEGPLEKNFTIERIKMVDTCSVVKKNDVKLDTSLNNVNGCESIPLPGNNFI